jgi:hypothetical protein
MRAALLALVLCGALMGCRHGRLSALTTSPPGAVSTLATDDSVTSTLTLTEGIAVALECNAMDGLTCDLNRLYVAPNAIAPVYLGYGDFGVQRRTTSNGATTQASKAVFIVTGARVGTQVIDVPAGSETLKLVVNVIPQK